MIGIQVHRGTMRLEPDAARVIIRPFIPADKLHLTAIIGRALALPEQEVAEVMQAIYLEFGSRHVDIDTALLENYDRVQAHVFTQRPISSVRMRLVGALFSGEYALEAAALFNPSIVPHPDQSKVAEGGLRIVMSLRATGEGHISSIEFRDGLVSPSGDITLVPTSRFATVPQMVPNPRYQKRIFVIKLHEMGFDNECASAVMERLGEEFTGSDLAANLEHVQRESLPISSGYQRTLDCIRWLADSNYEIRFAPDSALSERIIFPVSTNESNGIEDARFVRFTDDDGRQTYYATYTAYSGHDILPQMIETPDFLDFRVLTLNGSAVQNKGMALFPRRINGRYIMLSRQDNENLYIMSSENPHYWSDSTILLRPAEPWESVKLGNCGSPIETPEGWLVITHGVGPMRKYCIGAVLLDLGDPSRVIGRLREPLLVPEANERNGYVPNVLYSCGSLIHNDEVILPYAMSDTATSVASVSLRALLDELNRS